MEAVLREIYDERLREGRRHKRRGFRTRVGKIPWSRKWKHAQFPCLENSMDREAWWATVYGVAKSQTRLCTHTHIVQYVLCPCKRRNKRYTERMPGGETDIYRGKTAI